MAKSYYAILGVASTATADEIRTAYRRLAMEYHPDHYTGGSDVFRQIQDAYAVLGNPQKRRQYERQTTKARANPPVHATPHRRPEPLIPEQTPLDMGEISPVRSFERFTPSFDEVFDWLWRNFSSLDPPKSGRMQSLTMEVVLTPGQARRGGNARVLVPARAVCPTCRGDGGVGPYECARCAGEGVISGEVPIAVAFPPGLTADHAVMIPLERFGITNLQLTVLFRISAADV
jgi:molecular chaperone DnaJ